MLKTLKSFSMAFCFILALLQTSCNSDDDNSGDCDNIACTAIFIRINVTVVDENQDPVALDAFEVINTQNGQDMTIELSPSEFEGAQEFGLYPLIEDGVLGLNQERDVEFRGFIGGEEVVSGNYTVGTDCCHVSLKSGNPQLTL